MTVAIEEHDSTEEAHRKECSFCALAYALDRLFGGHAVEEVWEVTSVVLLYSMSEMSDDDEVFIKAAACFQKHFATAVAGYLLERGAARERAGMH